MNVVLVFLFVVSKVMCNIPQSEEDPRILIIGGTIRGRFKLGSSLLGRDTNRKRKQGECFSSLFPTCIEKHVLFEDMCNASWFFGWLADH